MFSTITEQLKEIREEIQNNKDTNSKIIKCIENQEIRLDNLEKDVKRRNVIIYGVSDDKHERYEAREEKVIEILRGIGSSVTIENVDSTNRLGIFKDNNNRPILVRFITERAKKMVLSKAKNLKGKDIWINEDYTTKIQHERKLLVPKLKEMREKGYKAYIKYNQLIVDDKVYQTDENDKVYKQTKKRTVSERSPKDRGDKIESEVGKLSKNLKM